MALMNYEKKAIIQAVNDGVPPEQIPSLGEPEAMELYQKLIAGLEMNPGTVYPLEDEDDNPFNGLPEDLLFHMNMGL